MFLDVNNINVLMRTSPRYIAYHRYLPDGVMKYLPYVKTGNSNAFVFPFAMSDTTIKTGP